MLAELGYGFAYRVLDAQFFGVAQRRKRVFVVGYLGDWRPAAAVLFERDSLSGNPAPSREAKEDVAGTFKACASSGGWGNSVDHAAAGYMQPVALGRNNGAENAVLFRPVAFGQNRSSGPVHVSHALTGHAGPVGRLDFSSETFLVQPVQYNGMAVRRLTPEECESLQGFPRGFTKIPYRGKSEDKCPDGPRYKALGNSMAAPCMKWLGERIQQVQEITEKNAKEAAA
jgi:DNA (cytosine-5)-methyltransferase 1